MRACAPVVPVGHAADMWHSSTGMTERTQRGEARGLGGGMGDPPSGEVPTSIEPSVSQYLDGIT